MAVKIFKYLLFLIPSQLFSQSINEYIEAVGGETRWKNVSTLQAHLTVSIQTGSSEHSNSYSVTKFISGDGKYRADTKQIGFKSTTLYSDGALYNISDDYVFEESDRVVEEYKRREFHFGEPWILLNSKSVRLIGKVMDSTQSCSVYEVIYRGFKRDYYVREVDSLLQKITMFDNKTVIYFTDYKDVDGFVIPFEWTGYVDGVFESRTRIKSIVLNKPIDESLFKVKER